MPIEVFSNEGKWIIKISKEGKITFNREDYPDSSPDDFAKAFIEILENKIVDFEKVERAISKGIDKSEG